MIQTALMIWEANLHHNKIMFSRHYKIDSAKQIPSVSLPRTREEDTSINCHTSKIYIDKTTGQCDLPKCRNSIENQKSI